MIIGGKDIRDNYYVAPFLDVSEKGQISLIFP